jgi:hypothetical protein
MSATAYTFSLTTNVALGTVASGFTFSATLTADASNNLQTFISGGTNLLNTNSSQVTSANADNKVTTTSPYATSQGWLLLNTGPLASFTSNLRLYYSGGWFLTLVSGGSAASTVAIAAYTPNTLALLTNDLSASLVALPTADLTLNSTVSSSANTVQLVLSSITVSLTSANATTLGWSSLTTANLASISTQIQTFARQYSNVVKAVNVTTNTTITGSSTVVGPGDILQLYVGTLITLVDLTNTTTTSPYTRKVILFNITRSIV